MGLDKIVKWPLDATYRYFNEAVRPIGALVLIAAVVGVPLYTSNLTALPLVGALVARGMNPSAALAFLIAGPTTTIPAMAAVWGLVRRRVFVLYVGFALGGAITLGALHCLVTSL